MAKRTNDLMEELSGQDTDLDRYFEENPTSFINVDIKEFWKKAVDTSSKTKSDIINKADMSYCYFYDVINGRKIPSKDKIIRIALAMNLSLDDCQEALRISGKSALYPRIKRDSILIYAINKRYSIYQTNDLLLEHGEEMLK